MFSLNVHTNGFNLRTQLAMSHYTQMFHCKKRYGLSYGRFGLITLAAFAKVSVGVVVIFESYENNQIYRSSSSYTANSSSIGTTRHDNFDVDKVTEYFRPLPSTIFTRTL